MSRRRVFLEEMGIGPRWRLRSRSGQGGATDARAPSDAADESPAATGAEGNAAALQSLRADEATYRAVPSAESAPAQSALPAGERGAVRAARGKAAPSPQAEARRQRILQMDWDALRASVAECVACPLNEKRKQTVFGVGDEKADWLFVGEGPGAEEDAKGEPFVGQAGRLLDNMLAAIDLARGENVYIANVVKCRPPNNRNPESGEMNCCEPYLARQIALIQPKLIVALGKTAANHLLETDASIASLRARVHTYRGIPLIVTYHPAYLLRSLPEKAKAWIDLCFARETMAGLQAKAL